MSRIEDLRKFVVPEFVFGVGARKMTGKYACNLGIRNPLLVSDPGVVAAGWLDSIMQSLDACAIRFTTFTGVSPNPRDSEVMYGAEIYRQNGCDGIVVIGGGSPIDCAKGIGIIVGNHGDILAYEGVDTIVNPGPPTICIPTTAGTSADVSQFAIILDTPNRNKIAIISKMIVPDVALIDPETTVSMDPFLTACTGLDALTHAIEALSSNASSVITDLHAHHAIDLIQRNILTAIREPDNIDARSNMTLASLEAGMAFSNASLGAVHAMAHSLGGYLDLPHGECNAILLSHVLRFNAPRIQPQIGGIAKIFNLESERMSAVELQRKVPEAINRLRQECGIPPGLGSLGVKTADIPELAGKALKDPCMLTNPKNANRRDLEVIYEESI